MKNLILVLAFFLGTSRFVMGAEAPPSVEIDTLASPAAAGAKSPFLATGPGGAVWLIWLEPAAQGATLRCAAFDAAANRWGSAHTIAAGPQLVVSAAETPLLTISATGRLIAAWPESVGEVHHVVFSSSADAGVTWTAPEPLSRETTANEFAALTTLADGRVLAAWLDGRATTKTTRATRLYARILDFKSGSAPANPASDVLIDSLVCDCCSLALTAFPDGTALLVYRGRTADEIRDIHVSRFGPQGWSESRVLNHDLWRIAGCPVNGPRLASDGGRVAATWFTAADNQPRVLLSTSPDAGTRFLLPLTVDLGHPTGHSDTVLLHDGTALVTWLEAASPDPKAQPAGLWLRRASPEFSLDEPILLSSASATQPAGFPRAVLVRDFFGDSLTAQLLIAYPGKEGVHTLLVSVPESELLASSAANCHCAPPPAQLGGFPIRGTVAGPASKTQITANHPEFPGLLAAGTDTFRAAPAVLAALPPGREFLGRIERRAGEWWLFDVRLLVAPPPKNSAQP